MESLLDPKTFPSLVHLLQARAVTHPDSPALTFLREGEVEAERWTYAELNTRARSIARALSSHGAAGRTVLLLYPSSLEFAAAFWGCLYAGAVAVPAMLPRSARHVQRLAPTLHDADPLLVLSTRDLLPRLDELGQGSALASLPKVATDALPPTSTEHAAEAKITAETLAFLQYTSGSTGRPKGVMVRHRHLLANHGMLQEACAQHEGCTWVVWMPLYHDMGLIGSFLQALYVGGHCVLMPPEAFLMKPLRWLRAIERYRAHSSGGPNFAYELCLRRTTPDQRAALDLRTWVNAFNGAEPVRAGTVRRFMEAFAPAGFQPSAFFTCYGMAEATLLATSVPYGKVPRVLAVDATSLERGQVEVMAETVRVRLLVSCGGSVGGGEVIVAHPESGERCPELTVGEIWLAGPHITGGYWQQPSETEHTFAARLAGSGEGPFLRTGDLGFLYAGELYVTGRWKDLIIMGGRNHYPADVELTVEQAHPALQPAGMAAFSIEEAEEERLVVVAEVARAARTGCMPAEVVAAVRKAVAEEHGLMVHTVHLLPPATLPKTTSGKTQRGACRQAFLAGTLPSFSS